MSEPEPFTDQQLEQAVAALSDPERFRDAETRLAKVAPGLQKILGEVLHGGGYLGESEDSQIRQALAHEDPNERAAAVAVLLAEEARLGLWVGVAVGWELARELDDVK